MQELSDQVVVGTSFLVVRENEVLFYNFQWLVIDMSVSL